MSIILRLKSQFSLLLISKLNNHDADSDKIGSDGRAAVLVSVDASIPEGWEEEGGEETKEIP
jgi:hypothetical protein